MVLISSFFFLNLVFIKESEEKLCLVAVKLYGKESKLKTKLAKLP